MCICSVHEVWFWLILSLLAIFTFYTFYLDRNEREYDRQIARLERENDKLEGVIYDLETNILDLEEKLENERTRLKATINLLSK